MQFKLFYKSIKNKFQWKSDEDEVKKNTNDISIEFAAVVSWKKGFYL